MRLNKLKVSGKHPTWCGPSALSIMTGRTVNYCAKLMADYRNKFEPWRTRRVTSKMVKGAGNREVFYALSKMGYGVKPVTLPKKTIRSYMAGRGGPNWKAVILIEAGWHYVVVNRDTIADNHDTSHYSEHPFRLNRIKQAWIVKRLPKR